MGMGKFCHPTLEVLCLVVGAPNCGPIRANDTDWIEFAQNLEFLEAEFYLNAALGQGLDTIAPSFAKGGPPPFGVRKANLDPLVSSIIEEFGYEEVGHLRAIITTVGGIPRPLLDLSSSNFAKLFNQAFGFDLSIPFDPYLNTINFLLATYLIPYVGLVGYVGTIPNLTHNTSLSLVASLLGVEAGQDAVIRTLLYERADENVVPYNVPVATLTALLSDLRNRLAMCGNKDKGIIVPLSLGAENRTHTDVLSANSNSLSFSRTPPEILRILYGTASEYKPGGFYHKGANGNIAKSFLNQA